MSKKNSILTFGDRWLPLLMLAAEGVSLFSAFFFAYRVIVNAYTPVSAFLALWSLVMALYFALAGHETRNRVLAKVLGALATLEEIADDISSGRYSDEELGFDDDEDELDFEERWRAQEPPMLDDDGVPFDESVRANETPVGHAGYATGTLRGLGVAVDGRDHVIADEEKNG